jgi:alpha-1,6-mannosyltransferase
MLFVGGLLLVNAAASIVSLWGAVVNYPGGTALCQFNQQFGNISSGSYPFYKNMGHLADRLCSTAPVHVHISNLAAQTGASLFLQANSPPYLAILSPPAGDKHWIYSKVENLTTSDLTRGTYTHLIVETPLDPSLKQAWNVVGSADGFAAYSVGRWLQMAKRMDLPEILEGTKKGGPFRPQVGEQLIILERK